MFFDKYVSHLQEVEEFVKRVFRFSSTRIFQIKLDFSISNILIFPKTIFKNDWGFSEVISNDYTDPKFKIIGFGSHGHVH